MTVASADGDERPSMAAATVNKGPTVAEEALTVRSVPAKSTSWMSLRSKDTSARGEAASPRAQEQAVAALLRNPDSLPMSDELEEPYFNVHITSSASQYGWFESEQNTEEEGAIVRDAWLQVVRGDSPDFEVEHASCNYDVLFLWENARPTVANKYLSSAHLDTRATGMNLSGCVSGFRIVNLGVIHAQFSVIVSYGSQTYKSWKRYSDFAELYNVVQYLHDDQGKLFARSLSAWEMMAQHKSVFRNLEVKYLIKKSIYLGKFIESLIFEAPSPGLMLNFIRGALWEAPEAICNLLTA